MNPLQPDICHWCRKLDRAVLLIRILIDATHITDHFMGPDSWQGIHGISWHSANMLVPHMLLDTMAHVKVTLCQVILYRCTEPRLMPLCTPCQVLAKYLPGNLMGSSASTLGQIPAIFSFICSCPHAHHAKYWSSTCRAIQQAAWRARSGISLSFFHLSPLASVHTMPSIGRVLAGRLGDRARAYPCHFFIYHLLPPCTPCQVSAEYSPGKLAGGSASAPGEILAIF